MTALLTDVALYELITKAKEEAENKGPKDVYVYLYDGNTLHFSNKPITNHGSHIVTAEYFVDKNKYIITTDMVPWYSDKSSITAITSEQKLIPSIDLTFWFSSIPNLSNISALSDWKTNNVKRLYSLFQGSHIADISALSNWKTDEVTDMSAVFEYCYNISDISALSNWKTDEVTTMSRLFNGCTSIKSFEPLNSWNVSKVTSHMMIFDGTTGTRPTWGTSW